MLSLLFLVCLLLGTAWTLQAARGTFEQVVGFFPAGMFVFFWLAGGVTGILVGHFAGIAVMLGGWLFSLLVLVAIGNRFRARRMSEVIRAA